MGHAPGRAGTVVEDWVPCLGLRSPLPLPLLWTVCLCRACSLSPGSRVRLKSKIGIWVAESMWGSV